MNSLSKSVANGLLIPEVAVLYGRRVHLNENLTVPGPTKVTPRTWKERLFSLPWHPLQKERYEQTRLPSRQIYLVGLNDVVLHPETYRELKEKLGADFLYRDKPLEMESPFNGDVGDAYCMEAILFPKITRTERL